MTRSILGVAGSLLTILCLTAATAEAGIVFNELNTVNFQNREIVTLGADDTMSAGDRIEGLLYINEINSASGAQQPPAVEVTGIFDLTVAFVIAAGNIDGIAGGTLIDPTSVGVDGYDGTAIVLFKATGAGGRLAGHAAGTALALYEGGPADTLATLEDGTKTAEDTFTAASDGTHLGDFGFTDSASPSDWGAAGNGYWAAVVNYGLFAGKDPGESSDELTFFYGLNAFAGTGPLADAGGGPNELQNVNLSGLVGTHFAAGSPTSILDNLTGGSTGFHWVGRGNQGPNNSTDPDDQAKFAIASNDPAQIYPNPEPASMLLALLGAGCCAPIVRRRRKIAEELV